MTQIQVLFLKGGHLREKASYSFGVSAHNRLKLLEVDRKCGIVVLCHFFVYLSGAQIAL
jgi:hypothetical protein